MHEIALPETEGRGTAPSPLALSTWRR